MPKRFRHIAIAATGLAIGLLACQSNNVEVETTKNASEATFLSSPEHLALGFPFSEAVQIGNMLYLSGQVGNVPGTSTVVDGGSQAETHQIFENIQGVLERNGSSLDRVVKCTAMLDDIAEWPAMNEIYTEYFPGPKPVRSALGADGLALGAKIELECWATVD